MHHTDTLDEFLVQDVQRREENACTSSPTKEKKDSALQFDPLGRRSVANPGSSEHAQVPNPGRNDASDEINGSLSKLFEQLSSALEEDDPEGASKTLESFLGASTASLGEERGPPVAGAEDEVGSYSKVTPTKLARIGAFSVDSSFLRARDGLRDLCRCLG